LETLAGAGGSGGQKRIRILAEITRLRRAACNPPARERARLVEAFQAGQGDLFLISLKAGGSGLNLTGADYVIHLDPWWNPAVEDQATDRAHRIGQTRPVTVYRLVLKDSIEESILSLHAAKRALTADFLEDAEAAGALGEDELMALIRG
jgi:SNF2 family DNA or RNA helicase